MNRAGDLPEVDPAIPAGAVSVYGQGDAMDDFPVLKAFQQYVDAEHAKAQKRMTTLCIFFVTMMLLVVGVFVMLLMSMSQRNNTLSDQLLAYMMKDRERASAPAAAQEGAALRTVTESLAAMQRELMAQQSRLAEERMKFATEALTRAGEGGSSVGESERAAFQRQQREHAKSVEAETQKLKRSRDMIKAERERLAKERERLKQKELDLQRRRLYPELYEGPRVEGRRPRNKQSAPSYPKPVATRPAAANAYPAASAARAAAREPVFEDEEAAENAAIDAEIEAMERMDEDLAAPALPGGEPADGSIRYFDDEDDGASALVRPAVTPDQVIGPQRQSPARTEPPASVPVNIGNTSAEWSIPMD